MLGKLRIAEIARPSPDSRERRYSLPGGVGGDDFGKEQRLAACGERRIGHDPGERLAQGRDRRLVWSSAPSRRAGTGCSRSAPGCGSPRRAAAGSARAAHGSDAVDRGGVCRAGPARRASDLA